MSQTSVLDRSSFTNAKKYSAPGTRVKLLRSNGDSGTLCFTAEGLKITDFDFCYQAPIAYYYYFLRTPGRRRRAAGRRRRVPPSQPRAVAV